MPTRITKVQHRIFSFGTIWTNHRCSVVPKWPFRKMWSIMVDGRIETYTICTVCCNICPPFKDFSVDLMVTFVLSYWRAHSLPVRNEQQRSGPVTMPLNGVIWKSPYRCCSACRWLVSVSSVLMWEASFLIQMLNYSFDGIRYVKRKNIMLLTFGCFSSAWKAAAFQPFYREHAHIDTARREPWLFGDDNTRLIRQAIEQRYVFLPYWYTLFYRQEKLGAPPMLPLWANFPKDKNTFKTEDSFMVGTYRLIRTEMEIFQMCVLGNGLLVYPITEADVNQVSIYFPGENTVRTMKKRSIRIFILSCSKVWYDTRTFAQHNGSETALINVDMESVSKPISSHPLREIAFPFILQIPIYQRGGVIIPQRLRKRRASMLAIHDPITLVVALDRNVSDI